MASKASVCERLAGLMKVAARVRFHLSPPTASQIWPLQQQQGFGGGGGVFRDSCWRLSDSDFFRTSELFLICLGRARAFYIYSLLLNQDAEILPD